MTALEAVDLNRGADGVGAASKRPRADVLRVRCYSSFEAAAALAEEWDDLTRSCGADVFTTFDWCRIWWKHFGHGRTLQIETYFQRNGALVAVLPLFREPLCLGPLRLHVLRLVGADHGVTTSGFLVAQDQIAGVAETFGRRLRNDPSWDLVQLAEIPGYCKFAAAFADRLDASAESLEVKHDPRHYPQMVFRLPATYDEYLAQLGGSERGNIRKRERRLAESHHVAQEVVEATELPTEFEKFVQQHEAQWRAEGQLGHFGDWPGSRAFQQEIAATFARNGRLMLVRVNADGETIGYQYNLAFNQRVHWITGSRTLDSKWETVSPGRLLHCATVRSAIADGARLLDGLGGYYEFKRRLGAEITGLQSITITRHSGSNRATIRAFVTATRMIDAIYHRLWYWHLAPAIRRRVPAGLDRIVARGLRTPFIRSRFLVAGRVPRSLRFGFTGYSDGPSNHTDS